MKKIVLVFVFIMLFQPQVISKEITVKIKPASKITTSDLLLKNGDDVEFIVSEDVFLNSKVYLKKDEKVDGIITELVNNNYILQPAELYIENFKTKNVNNVAVKLNGVIYKKGNEHQVFGEILGIIPLGIGDILLSFVRGGEVQIKPEKDEFTIYLEEKL